MRALGPTAALRESLLLFRQRPFATLALGLALLTSLVAVSCYGLGIVAAPWFLCELFALQIALGRGERPPRTRAWLWAGFVQGLAVMFLCTVVAITLLSVGPDVVLGAGSDKVRLAGGVLRSLLVWILAGGLTLALTVHFEHAPALLLDRGGTFSSALLESALLVRESGVLRTWFTSGVAHGLQLAPIVLGVTAAAAFGTLSSTITWGLVLLPVAAFSLAVGQGMVVASYLALRPGFVDCARLPASAALTPARGLLWTALMAAVFTGPVAVSAALLRPSLPRPGALGREHAPLLVLDAQGRDSVTRFIPDTALTVQLSATRVVVQASDGGGAGAIPLPAGKLARVRVARVARADALPAITPEERLFDSVFALELALRDGRTFTTWIDEAGVRVDDSAGRRLSSLLPPWALWLLGLCMVWTAAWIGIAMPPQARARRELAARAASDASDGDTRALGQAFARRALGAAALLAPAALGSLAIGLWAAFGEGTLPP